MVPRNSTTMNSMIHICSEKWFAATKHYLVFLALIQLKWEGSFSLAWDLNKITLYWSSIKSNSAPGPMQWSCGPVVLWSCSPVVLWSCELLVHSAKTAWSPFSDGKEINCQNADMFIKATHVAPPFLIHSQKYIQAVLQISPFRVALISR